MIVALSACPLGKDHDGSSSPTAVASGGRSRSAYAFVVIDMASDPAPATSMRRNGVRLRHSTPSPTTARKVKRIPKTGLPRAL